MRANKKQKKKKKEKEKRKKGNKKKEKGSPVERVDAGVVAGGSKVYISQKLIAK